MKAIEVHDIGKKYRKGKAVHNDLRSYLMGRISLLKNNRVDGDSDFWALKDISFSVEQGETLGIIGANGSGKSTLLKILSRITTPTTGHVKIKGRVSSLLEVGTGFHPELTGRENIYLNGAILGMKRKEITSHFDEIVDFSGVEEFIDTPVKHYSSGMYLRLAFSVAAYLVSDILLIDEVLSVGDVAFQKKSVQKIMELTKMEGRTVLFVSHNHDVVRRICNSGIFLSNGALVEKNTIDDSLKLYLSTVDTSIDKSIILGNEDGNDSFVITRLHICYLEKLVEEISCGSDFSICVKYKSQKYLRGALIRLDIFNFMGVKLASLNSRISNRETDIPNIDGEFICHIKQLPLNVGSYRVGLVVKELRNIIYRNENVLALKITSSNFYDTHDLPGPQSPILLNYHWEIKAC